MRRSREWWMGQIAMGRINLERSLIHNGSGLANQPCAGIDTLTAELKYRKIVDQASMDLRDCLCRYMPDEKKCQFCWELLSPPEHDADMERKSNPMRLPTPDEIRVLQAAELDSILESYIKSLDNQIRKCDWQAGMMVHYDVAQLSHSGRLKLIELLKEQGWTATLKLDQKDGDTIQVRMPEDPE